MGQVTAGQRRCRVRFPLKLTLLQPLPGADLEPRGGFHCVVLDSQWPESTSPGLSQTRPRVRHLPLEPGFSQEAGPVPAETKRWAAGTVRTTWLLAMCQPVRHASMCPRESPRGLRKGHHFAIAG